MELVEYDEPTAQVTLRLSNVELGELSACVGYIHSTFDDQDTVYLGLPGEEGKAHVAGLNQQIQAVLARLNQQFVHGRKG